MFLFTCIFDLINHCIGTHLTVYISVVLVAQSYPILCDPMDSSPPVSSVHGILQARILEWVAIPFSRDLPNPGIEARSPELEADFLNHLSYRELLYWDLHTSYCLFLEALVQVSNFIVRYRSFSKNHRHFSRKSQQIGYALRLIESLNSKSLLCYFHEF